MKTKFISTMLIISKTVKSWLIDAKRWAEHFWAWDLKPLFGKEQPSQWIVGKLNEHFILMQKFTPVFGYLPGCDVEKHLKRDIMRLSHLHWSKAIHAYVNVSYDAMNELINESAEELKINKPNKPNEFVFKTLAEANFNAVLQGLTDEVLPFEDFGEVDYLDFLPFRGTSDIDLASMHSILVHQFTNAILNELDKEIEKEFLNEVRKGIETL